ncbi:MAG: MarR family transcriptional regulator [Alphaproteobacteria bacterium]|nr:MarR family transcriptional regulator [Alphaproteobacteria bacterium]MDX5414696.1 MarR family transcriptional regulator [Alphaproteobacteria bacterium]MDX5491877.1 MarR family transcriptional regulator [Alphaproteobacteria bacterium]
MTRKEIDLAEATIHIRDHCLCLHAQRAARALARRFDDALRPYGITSGQFSLLNVLNRREPVAMGPVAKFLAMDRSTLTANLKPLERQGLISIEVDPDDRRSRKLILTAEGRKVLRAAVPVWKSEHAALEAEIGGDPDALRAGLRAIA